MTLRTSVPNALPALIAFDLDDTLAPSKTRLDDSMADLLAALLDATEVCIISGGKLEQFERQVLDALPPDAELSRLHLMPTCGTKYLRWDGTQWQLRYSVALTEEQKQRTIRVLEHHARALGLWSATTWGDIIEDRDSQITFSALGQRAPVEAKAAWDPDGTKKESLRAAADPELPDLEVRSGGSTSVDVTLKGVDKAFGIAKLAEATGIPLDDMLFIGDRLDPGGNDYPVLALGVACLAVDNWQHTRHTIATLLEAERLAS